MAPSGSSVDQLHSGFAVAVPLDRQARQEVADLTQVTGSQPHIGTADILLKAMALGRAGDRHDPGLLRQQARQRDLSGRDALPGGKVNMCRAGAVLTI
jgi:hypothetical protein